MTGKARIALESVVCRDNDLLSQPVDSDLVMANLHTGHYYGLAQTGKRIWDLLAQPVAVSTLCSTLCREYEVDPATCQADVLGFLNDLADEQLVHTIG